MLQRRVTPAKKYLRRTLQVAAFVGTLVVGIIALALIATQTPWFRDWLRKFVIREANQYVNGTVAIGSLGGDLFYGVQLRDVSIDVNGQPVVRLKQLELKYSLAELISSGMTVRQIRLDQPFIQLRHDASGWNIASLIKRQQQEADRQGPGKPMSMPDIEIVDGRVAIDDRAPADAYRLPKQIAGLNARAGYAYAPVHYSLTLDQMSFAATDPALSVKTLTGRVGTSGDDLHVEKLALQTGDSSATIDGVIKNYLGTPSVQMTLTAPRLSLPEFSAVLPAVQGYALHPSLDVKAQGSEDALTLSLNETSEAGAVRGTVTADVLAPDYGARGSLSVQDVDLAPLLKDPAQRSDITGTARLDLRMATAPAAAPALDRLRGTVTIDAPKVIAAGYRANDVKVTAEANGRHVAIDGRAAAYGATATAKGTVVAPAATGAPVQFDLAGAVTHVNLANMPANLRAPRTTTDLNVAEYHVKGAAGTRTAVDGDATFGASHIVGGTIDAGTAARFSVATGKAGLESLTYDAHGGVRDLNLYDAGRAFQVAALARPDYDSRINATFTAQGSGVALNTMRLDATAAIANTQIYGGTIPQLNVEAHVAGNAAHGHIAGALQGFNPGKIAGNPQYAGHVNGAVDLTLADANLSAPLGPDAITADGKVTLAQSDVAGLKIDSADLEGQYANRRGTLRQATIKGPDLDVQASGPIALDESGQSNVKLHAALTNLADLGKLANQPISGTAVVDVTLTGNASSLVAAGSLTGSDLAYQKDSVLSLKSTFTATVPNLQIADARFQAQTSGTLIQAAGIDLNTLTANTTYANHTLDFQTHVAEAPAGKDAEAAAGQKGTGARELDAGGSVIFHPDHQEIHLPSLDVRTQGVEWKTAPGSQATVNYANNQIQVQDVRLVNGAQSLNINGAFSLGATPSSTGLTVQAQNVDISQLERLALMNNGFTGTLNANAKVAGSAKAPEITGHVDVQNGGVQQFKFQSFSVDGGFRNNVATIDARLVQSPGVELTAKGTAPLSALEANPPGVNGHVPGTPGDEINVHVQSTNINLGIIEGFTNQVTKVSGTLQADFTVTGSGHDPHLNGYVAVNNGAFALPLAGTHFSGLTTRIELQPDVVKVPRFQILDNDGSPLTVEGELAVHAASPSTAGAVNVSIQSKDFKIADNSLGKVAVNTNLHLTGDLRAPRIEGDVSTPEARLELDKILLLTANPYSTEELPPVVSAEDTTSTDKGAEDATRDALAKGRQVGAAQPAQPTASPAASPQSGPLGALAMNIHFTAPDDLIVRGNDIRTSPTAGKIGNVNATLGVDLRLTKRADAPIAIRGTVSTVRGFYEFQGRRFTLERDGTLRFDGLPEINPSVDVTADRLIPNSGVTATIHVTGTMLKPEIALSSDPPLDESDILSLIVFNRSVNELGTGERASLAETAGGIASGFVASSLGNAIGKALDVDQFEITTSDPDTGESAGGVTLGKQVTDKAFIRFRQQFGDRSFTEFMMEYQLSKFLRAEAQVAPETSGVANRLTERRVERAGVDLLFFFSY